jgi:RNA polymerase sigma-70 factor (ECF subfamily)
MYARAETERLEDLADADLVHRVKRGDDEALDVLLRRYMDDLYRFCCHLVSNRQDAEDICQESLTRAIDRADTLERGSAFRGWLFCIARNLSVDVFRQRRRICTLFEEEATPPPLRVEGPQESVVVGEEHQTVAQALSRLTRSHQRVLLLREVEGLSYADIGEHLNVSHSAVETLLFRARRRLREEYRQAQLSPVCGLIHRTHSSVHVSRSASG